MNEAPFSNDKTKISSANDVGGCIFEGEDSSDFYALSSRSAEVSPRGKFSETDPRIPLAV